MDNLVGVHFVTEVLYTVQCTHAEVLELKNSQFFIRVMIYFREKINFYFFFYFLFLFSLEMLKINKKTLV